MRTWILTLLLTLATAAVGSPPPDDKPPEWAKVSPEQVETAKRLGVPVAFENPVGMRFVLIPPGKFTMGSPKNEESRRDDETQHQVEITRACYMAIHETTNAQYQRFDASHRGSWNDADVPVETVSHDDATKFVAWLNTQDRGHEYRLPTEAEWEYACRAGTKTPFWFGDTISTDQANYDGGYTCGTGVRGAYREKTTPVGSFPPNGWGLFDMHGNLWEWCADWYDPGYYAESPRQDPPGPPSGRDRVLRGGPWGHTPKFLRSAFRLWDDPRSSNGTIGFRVVVAVPGAPAKAEQAVPPPPPPPADERPPAWAKVSKEQIDAAKRLGVPVAFENPIGMRFVLIPPGRFTMGSPPNEESRDTDETQHEVEITKAFYMAIHETTNAQYKRFDARHDGQWDEGDQPVETVSHDDATRFVAWLDTQDRARKYRLPTEAEWEYACRAGTKTPFSFGETIGTRQANYDGNYTYGRGVKGAYREKTTAVGSFPANGWGLFDMHGNLHELCADWYDGGYYAKSPGQDPPGPARGSARVLRGGSWGNYPGDLRSASRCLYVLGVSFDFIGFRVVAVSAAPK